MKSQTHETRPLTHENRPVPTLAARWEGGGSHLFEGGVDLWEDGLEEHDKPSHAEAHLVARHVHDVQHDEAVEAVVTVGLLASAHDEGREQAGDLGGDLCEDVVGHEGRSHSLHHHPALGVENTVPLGGHAAKLALDLCESHADCQQAGERGWVGCRCAGCGGGGGLGKEGRGGGGGIRGGREGGSSRIEGSVTEMGSVWKMVWKEVAEDLQWWLRGWACSVAGGEGGDATWRRT